MSYTIFLGAGFSKWAANLPTANELFDFEIEPWIRENNKLQMVRVLKQRWDKEHPNEYTEKFITEAMSLSKKQRETIIWYIARRLLEPFIYENRMFRNKRRHVAMIDNVHLLTPSGQRGVARARSFLTPFFSLFLNGIITTNYDLLVEYALGSKLFNYGLQYQILKGYRGRMGISDQIQLKGRMPLLKLHGSISWDTDNFYADGRCGLKGNALILPPTLGKQPYPNLEMPWELAHKILQKSQHLVFFGFAFNPYDQAVLELIRSAEQNLKTILVIDAHPQVERVKSLFPNAIIIPCQPPPAGDDEIKRWLRDIFFV